MKSLDWPELSRYSSAFRTASRKNVETSVGVGLTCKKKMMMMKGQTAHPQLSEFNSTRGVSG